ncbi:MAG TPA: serine/threonine-protein kinase [Candidatus Sulfotelmatobacter sp.]|nr:serine/threonine-protein kinase [Candidatus Sulfotelmatobacter sp.]
MSTKIGHFEILSELAKSPTGAVYKANDAESGQTIALKAIQLSVFGEHAAALQQALLAEAERTKALSCPNITPVFGAGEIEGQFCAAMEYVQGNSIATMLARKEGFSIWDLLDIGRQLCSGLDYAASQKAVHYSLEPSKIMCGWDGTVRILGYGVSGVGNFVQFVPEGLPTILHYMSPEQIQGQSTDGRSNLFSLGAMFYEMVTERKAFDRDDIEGLRQSVLESTPVPPIHVNQKVHPLLSDLIMKVLAKNPAERYQSGRELLDDLEKCKESKTLAAKKPDASKGTMAPAKAQAAAQSKFIASASAKPAAPRTASAPPASKASGVAKPASAPAAPAARAAEQKSALAKPSTLAKPTGLLAAPKAAAAAAGVGGGYDASPLSSEPKSSEVNPSEIQELDLSDQFVGFGAKPTMEGSHSEPEPMSSAVMDEPQVETFEPQTAEEDEAPKIAVDPMMAEGGSGGGRGGVSFSEMTELPPLKEVYIAPAPPPSPPSPSQSASAAVSAPTVYQGGTPKADERPKVQPRVVAQKAIKEIKGVPPKLMLYALGGAGALILAIGIGVTVYIHSQNSDEDSGAARPTAAAVAPAQPVVSEAPKQTPAPAPAPEAVQPTEVAEPEAPTAQPAPSPKSRNSRKKAAAPAVVIPGQLAVDSTPQGAQVQVDGRGEPHWVTPFALTNLQPGQHSITVSKPGFSTDTRTVEITSGNRATTVVHLAQLMATLVVKSDPPGANIYVDGRDVGAKTPAQVSVDKGQHVVLVRMMGYIDETMNAQFVLGQTFNFTPALRPLGNADNIKTVGKMSKLFGGKGAQAGQATLSIRTQPKGAQVAINQHIMDKNSPLDVALDPGNYVVDITLSGYEPIHKVITADKGGKVVVDEVLHQQ